MTGLTALAVWLFAAAVFFVIESASLQLVCIWFVAGSLGAAFAGLFHAPFAAQLWIFLLVSAAFLIFARPLLVNKIKVKRLPTNADRVIGMPGVVTETVDNLAGTGRVNANGLSWSARTNNNSIRLHEGQKITVLEIEGVKLIVEPIMED
ncbi:MAG: NfeD family protein [Oscillospiraceae bacterium]|nr:NfeD family protein [Oscillospiraceae bacterium]